MKQNNYKKGRQKEYRLKYKYEKLGCIVIRSAGSHSFADLVAIHPRKRKIIFIQSKPKNFSQRAKLRLEKKFAWLNDNFVVNFEVE